MLYALCFIIGFLVGIFPYKKLNAIYLKKTRKYADELAYGDIKNLFKDF